VSQRILDRRIVALVTILKTINTHTKSTDQILWPFQKINIYVVDCPFKEPEKGQGGESSSPTTREHKRKVIHRGGWRGGGRELDAGDSIIELTAKESDCISAWFF
jgi:hypothetical protein